MAAFDVNMLTPKQRKGERLTRVERNLTDVFLTCLQRVTSGYQVCSVRASVGFKPLRFNCSGVRREVIYHRFLVYTSSELH